MSSIPVRNESDFVPRTFFNFKISVSFKQKLEMNGYKSVLRTFFYEKEYFKIVIEAKNKIAILLKMQLLVGYIICHNCNEIFGKN